MTTTKTTKPNLNKHLHVYVPQHDIDNAAPCDPLKCMIRVSVARAIGVPHGYVFVDATGISVTRRKDYRERAFLPRVVVKNLLLFDNKHTRHLVKPFRFTLEFHKTTKVYKSSDERKAQINKRRAGVKRRKYSLRSRVMGIAIPKDLQELLQQ